MIGLLVVNMVFFMVGAGIAKLGHNIASIFNALHDANTPCR